MAVTQKGTTVTVGFNSITYTNFIMDDSNEEPIGDIDEIRDADNATTTKLISNPGTRYTLSGTLKGGSTELTTFRAIVKGSVLSVNSVNCMVESVSLAYNRLGAKGTITVIKETSMSY